MDVQSPCLITRGQRWSPLVATLTLRADFCKEKWDVGDMGTVENNIYLDFTNPVFLRMQ